MYAGPDAVRYDMVTLSALMRMFENSYLELAEERKEDLSEKERDYREKACNACYLIQDLADKVAKEMLELADHMEVCDAVFAVNHVKRMKKEGVMK